MSSDLEKRRFTQLHRTVQLIADLMAGKSHDRNSAAAALGIQPVSADRQLKAIARLPGVKVVKEGRRRVFRFDAAAISDPPSLAVLIGASFGASLGPLFEGTPYQKAFSDARDHLLRQSRRRGDFSEVERKFVFLSQGGEISLPEKGAQLDELIAALLEQYPVRIDYEDFASVVRSRRVEPLSLAVYNHQLYLLGRERTGELRSFRFSRIRSAEAEGRPFKYPTKAEYDPEQVFARSFGIFMMEDQPVEHVELKLHARWAAHVKSHRWHRSQRAVVLGGEVHIHLDVCVCPEVEAWVLSFGEEAEILRPQSLRDKLAKRAEALRQRYVTGG
ncbi:helix-turn-helix transcriptional regulator [Hyalangium minutum]|uniref:Transcriptional regulator, DeoR family protein n=1 Tax=Hyalangium minutum TaxID=394096 RepID=A0A085WFM1_9BACT|nr:WYL domain-containing protein [Hyalangium minutum]KFE66484.1 Transcriptional regulator, DeoR family protein [Hyalangium minutum]